MSACPAGGEHVFVDADESPVGPRRVVRCEECGAKPGRDEIEEEAA
jgi:hypothetical protein